MLFVDAATENVDAIPRRLRELGVRYDPAREAEFRSELQILFERYYGSRLSDIDPIQVIREGFQLIYAMNLQAAEPVRHPRQGDRDARVGRPGGLPGLQRLRGGEAVRARPARRSFPSACALEACPRRGARPRLGRARHALPGRRRARAVAPGNVPGAHREPRASTRSTTTSTRRRTASPSRW